MEKLKPFGYPKDPIGIICCQYKDRILDNDSILAVTDRMPVTDFELQQFDNQQEGRICVLPCLSTPLG